jgi:hypothetical protein
MNVILLGFQEYAAFLDRSLQFSILRLETQVSHYTVLSGKDFQDSTKVPLSSWYIVLHDEKNIILLN